MKLKLKGDSRRGRPRNSAKTAIYHASGDHPPEHPTQRRSKYKRPGVPRRQG